MRYRPGMKQRLAKGLVVVFATGFALAARPAVADEVAVDSSVDDEVSVDSSFDAEEAPLPAPMLGAGVRFHSVFMPKSVLELFVAHGVPLNSWSLGFELVKRRPEFDIVVGLEYVDVTIPDGLWEEPGEEPGNNCVATGMCPDHIRTDGLAMFGLDVAFLWKKPIYEGLSFRYGAGLGLGVILGGLISRDTVCPPGTTVDDLDTPSSCLITGPDVIEELPPVLPIVKAQLGLAYEISNRALLTFDAGLHNVFFFGGGAQYFF